MGIKLEIADDYLEQTLKHAAIKLVGETLANLETISNPDEAKAAIKNTIYQNFRDLNGQIRAFDCGVRFVRGPLSVKN
jgi:hypothetical protein